MAFVVPCGGGSTVFERVEEAPDQVSLPIEAGVAGPEPLSPRHQPDAGASAPRGEPVMQRVAVLSPVGQQGLARPTPATISAADRPSWAWPSVRFSRIGRPRASTTASSTVWIFVVPPRASDPWPEGRQNDPGIILSEGGSSPFFRAVGRVLVNPDRGGVEHLDIPVISL